MVIVLTSPGEQVPLQRAKPLVGPWDGHSIQSDQSFMSSTLVPLVQPLLVVGVSGPQYPPNQVPWGVGISSQSCPVQRSMGMANGSSLQLAYVGTGWVSLLANRSTSRGPSLWLIHRTGTVSSLNSLS